MVEMARIFPIWGWFEELLILEKRVEYKILTKNFEKKKCLCMYVLSIYVCN